ncbi:FliH/SctL family protein [Lacrimispora sp. 38-1]|uniref:FliH/SctL family protein n=1 Tax=Lacrimispora sp. 38-1 TaxID=3125778 RepID=UPI003CEFEE4B
MPNIIKGPEAADRVLEYGFKEKFEDIMVKKEVAGPEAEQFETDEEDEYLQVAEIFEKASERAEEIVRQAKEEAEKILTDARENGYQDGYEAGLQEGRTAAYEEHKEELDLRMKEFRETIKSTIESVTEEKNRILETYIDDLKRVTLTIAEKVIQTSLKSSGEIIKRMIVAAAGKLKKTQWVKIYVSQKDAGMMIQGDVGLLNELSHISGNIKIIAMDHSEEGTCIIELPEEIIDVSVNTQIENIKGILNNARL